MRGWRVWYAVAASVVLVAEGQGQNPVTRSPIQELLGQAHAALNDLRYAEAITLTQAVLSMQGLRRSDRIDALQVSAFAYFPDQTNSQTREKAAERLRQMIRIAPTATLAREASWEGLEALLQEVKSVTFGASPVPRGQYVLTGPDEEAQIEISTSRAAQGYAWLEPRSGEGRIVLDSAQINSRGVLRFRVLANGQPRIRSGDYRLLITVIDNFAPDTMRFGYSVTVKAPPIDYVEVPKPLDSTTFLPEVTKPHRVGGIVAGFSVMAATIAAGRVLRDSELKTAAAKDGRTIALGFVLGLGTAGGVWFLDKGAAIPANITANRQARESYARRVADAAAANGELLRTYKAEITLTPEEP
jgi:hypothetical protein